MTAQSHTAEAARDALVLKVAGIIDPPAFSDKYAPVLVSRHEKWLTNKNRRIRVAIAKADQVLAAVAPAKTEAVYAEQQYWRGILKERDLWIVDLVRERDAAIAKATGEAGTWQVKDFADGWIDVPNKAAAERLSAEQSDAAIRLKPAGGEAGQ